MIKYTKREMPDLDKTGQNKAYYKTETIGLVDSEELINYMSNMGAGVTNQW